MKTIVGILTLLISFNLFSTTSDEIENLYECISIRDIQISLEYEQVQWSPNDKPQRMCIFSFNVTSNGVHNIYLTRRWRSPDYCKKLISEWSHLKKRDRKVCIAGYLSYPEKKKVGGKEIAEAIGYWEVVKSEDWCHTYFVGNCKGIANSTESF